MAANAVSGYFVELGLVTNHRSFSEGQKKLTAFESSMKSLFGTAAKVSTALFGVKAASSSVATAELKAAAAIGISTGSLNKWKTAASIAGVSANGLTSSMASLEEKMRRLTIGEVDTGLAKSLGMLGVGYQDFAAMDAEARMKEIFSRAGGMKDQNAAIVLIKDTLGSAAEEYYTTLKLSGKTLDQQLKEAKSLTFTNEQSHRKAIGFHAEIKAIFGSLTSIGSLFGTELAAGLSPMVKQTKQYIIANKKLIQTKVIGVAHKTAAAFKSVFGTVQRLAPLVLKLVDGFGGLDGIITKVAIGFTMLNLTRVAGGIAGIVKGIGLLKTAMSGLLMGGAFLILEDLFGYFTGRDSLTGHIMNNLDSLKAQFEGMIPKETIESFKNSFGKISEIIEAIKKSMPELKKIWGEVFSENFKLMVEGIAHAFNDLTGAVMWLFNIFDAYKKEGFTGVLKYIGESVVNMGNNIGNSTTEGFNNSYNEAKANGWGDAMSNVIGFVGGTDAFISSIPLIGTLYDLDKWITQSARNLLWGAGKSINEINRNREPKGTSSINDGIIAPNGRITRVSPQDWVFAAKDVSNMAAAFMPPSLASATVNAQKDISIQQHFTFTTPDAASLSHSVMNAAQTGTRNALAQMLEQNTAIMQMMPGTR